jgi:replication factor A1
VRNVRIKDDTGDIRVALWGDKADVDIDLGQYAIFTDVQVKDGWQDELECSANWRSTVSVLDERPDDAPTHDAPTAATTTSGGSESQGSLSSFDSASDSSASSSSSSASAPSTADAAAAGSADDTTGERDDIEFTGTVVQAGSPVVLDDGTETYSVDTDASLRLGEEVTVRGRVRDGRIDAEDVF